MAERINRMSDPISRVKCTVSTCYFYKSGDHCLAEKIEVQPPHASNSQDTDCATFVPKNL